MRSSDDSTAEATPETAPSDLLSIEITYRSPDRFGWRSDSDPNHAHAQRIYAEIEGVTDGDEDGHVPLGSISLARVDLWEVGDRYWDVLDAESGEWTAYYDLVEAAHDRVQPDVVAARPRRDLGAVDDQQEVGVVARAIRTWGEDALVVMTACPPGGSGAVGKAGGEALSRHWSRLGLDRVDGSHPPLLVGSTDSARLASAIVELSDWHPPAAAG